MIKKGFSFFGGVILLLVTGVFVYLYSAFPAGGTVPDISISNTTEQIERGRYLANHVAVCIDCHSERDWSKFSGPIIEGTQGKGGELFDEKMGLPGSIYAKNITPYNLNA